MNVMKKAHEAVREAFAKVGHGIKLEYRPLFRAALIDLHKKDKAMKAQKTIKLAQIGSTFEADKEATWFSVEGTATDSEGNRVHIGYSGSTIGVQSEADWYFCRSNGFTNIDLYACVWGLEDVKQSFKIIR